MSNAWPIPYSGIGSWKSCMGAGWDGVALNWYGWYFDWRTPQSWKPNNVHDSWES